MIDELDEPIFLNADKFFIKVEELSHSLKLTYIDATLRACEYFKVDPEDIYKLKLINISLKDRLHLDGMNEGYLKRESQLPI